jgi:hypothetical protein
LGIGKRREFRKVFMEEVTFESEWGALGWGGDYLTGQVYFHRRVKRFSLES